MVIKPLLGVVSALVVIGGTLPYLRDILRKETKPSRATWTLLTLLLLLSAFVQHELGTGWGIALVLGEILACGSVAVLSLKYGHGGFETVDKICYAIWLAAVVLWLGLDKPLLALVMSLAADLVSMIPTLIKSYKTPEEESANIFIASAAAGFLGIFAAASFSFEDILFPVYILVINAAVAAILFVANRHKA